MANRYWVGGSGTWDTTSTTNWSASSGGGGGASVPTASDNVFFDQAGTYTVTMTGALTCLDFTVSAGTVTFDAGTNPTPTISGSMSLKSGTVWNSPGIITFNATTSKTITTNGVTFACNFNFNGVGGTWTLQDNLTSTSSNQCNFTNGTLDLNNKILTVFRVQSVSGASYGWTFGTSGQIAVTGNDAQVLYLQVWPTISGTLYINSTYTGGTGTRSFVIPVNLTEAQVPSFSTSGTSGIVIGTTATDTVSLGSNTRILDLNLTGFSGTYANASIYIYGNLTLPASGGTIAAGTLATTFAATSGTKTITTNGRTVDFPITFNGVGGTWALQDNLTVGSTRTTTLTNGTLSLGTRTLTTGAFASSNSNTRTLAFGTGQLALSRNNATIFNLLTATNFSVTGTVYVNSTYTGATGTRTFNTGFSESQASSFPVATSGTSGIVIGTTATDTVALTGSYGDVNLSGFTNTLSNTARTIYGNFTLPASGGTFTAGANYTTFGATSGTKTITTNGRLIDFNLAMSNTGSTLKLADALTMGSTRTLVHNTGTLDLNGKTLTVGSSYLTQFSGVKNLTFNGGTLVCPAVTATAFNNTGPTNFTTTAGTGTGKISMTGATAKTFVGGGSTFNCTLSNDGAGAMTITGSNTFTTLANGVQPTTFTFTAGTTQTVTNWNVSGTAGNLVTIGSDTTSAHTLSKSTGTVSADYLSISYSTATGGATWYAGANSTNGGNNTGWIFTVPPPPSTGNFLMMFN